MGGHQEPSDAIRIEDERQLRAVISELAYLYCSYQKDQVNAPMRLLLERDFKERLDALHRAVGASTSAAQVVGRSMRVEVSRGVVALLGDTADARREAIRERLQAAIASQQASEAKLVKLRRMREESLRRAEEEAAKSKTWIASDVHLGRSDSESEAFFHWLRAIPRRREVVLNGDILDWYIFDDGAKQRPIAERVAGQWKRLWRAIEELRGKECEVHLVPGNHDAFTFYVEAAPEVPWCARLLQKVPELLALRDRTQEHRLSAVCDIHYPFLSLRDREHLLFSHGHYEERYWRVLGGGDDNRLDPVWLISLGVEMAHKHSRFLRRMYLSKPGYESVRQLHDVAVRITSAVVAAWTAAGRRLDSDADEEDLEARVERAMAWYYSANVAGGSDDDADLIRDSLFALAEIGDDREDERLTRRADALRRLLARNPHGVSRTITGGATINMHTRRFRDLAGFRTLVLGHDHKPADGGDTWDIGGFVSPHRTALRGTRLGDIWRDPAER